MAMAAIIDEFGATVDAIRSAGGRISHSTRGRLVH
jgi:hypothetical protein